MQSMASMDDELEAIERAARAGPTEFTPSVVQPASPPRLKGSAASPAFTTTYNNPTKKATTTKISLSSGGRRRGSSGLVPEGATKKPLSAYINPNMTPEQQAALNALLMRSGQMYDKNNPIAISTPTFTTNAISNPFLKGSDLLVGFPGSSTTDDEEEEDDKQTTNNNTPFATTTTTTTTTTAEATQGSGYTGLRQSTQDMLAQVAGLSSDFSSSEDDEEEIMFRPTVDPMSRGGEAERIMKKQDEMYDLQMPAHRPYVGGFASAAFEASREFHYRQKAESAVEALEAKERIKDGRPPPSI
mmetsp:Transcript_20784/g.29635  ORF Transcript_20784/g.29635 Transcript_20784/m.29635 type:complete len:301 (+) Transcript_20784:71-973(+)